TSLFTPFLLPRALPFSPGYDRLRRSNLRFRTAADLQPASASDAIPLLLPFLLPRALPDYFLFGMFGGFIALIYYICGGEYKI
ncbi:MAG: hypothetical protein J6X81_05625, partial [Muribaculaceae bacterium]|nr:hypothetical protein [Muribaculaceae bacterium]